MGELSVSLFADLTISTSQRIFDDCRKREAVNRAIACFEFADFRNNRIERAAEHRLVETDRKRSWKRQSCARHVILMNHLILITVLEAKDITKGWTICSNRDWCTLKEFEVVKFQSREGVFEILISPFKESLDELVHLGNSDWGMWKMTLVGFIEFVFLQVILRGSTFSLGRLKEPENCTQESWICGVKNEQSLNVF